ncbi:3'-5' exonuclease [Natranaerofaba carboxydovora]|uniref:3'-5' exonuclease n=1 Tax=Natranaerofaba carboxydovora TaxID=2742683 RepID=UPI001F145BAA|nr:3'-5' exonuclease [Natranaerofaba carboxydovora]
MKEPRCAYLYQVLEYARQLESQGKTDFPSLVKKLKELLEKNPEEELDLFSRKESSVSLLNLHKAKGLQARVVFLANPGKKVDPKNFLSKHIQRLEDKPRGYFSFSRQRNFGRQEIAFPPNWEEIKAEELKYQQSEETRLLYVAATRAEELLVISDVAEPKVKKKNPWHDLIENSDEDIKELEIESLPAKEELAGTKDEGEKDKKEGEIATREVEAGSGIGSGEKGQTEDLTKLYASFNSDDLTRLKENTYMVKAPTDLQKKKTKVSSTSDAGSQDELEGALLGNIIHRAFEIIVKDKDKFGEKRKHELVKRLLKEHLGENRDTTQEKETINSMIDTFLSSDLFTQINHSPGIQTEVPFHLRTEPEENLHDYISQNLGDKDSENIDVPILFSGTMDLVYQKSSLSHQKDKSSEASHGKAQAEEDRGKWVIVDYKTDRVDEVESGEELSQHAEVYLPQLQVYKEVFEIITGEKVWDFGVYFARIGEYVSIDES